MLRSPRDCLRRLEGANYLVATADDLAVDLETAPGGHWGVRTLLPEHGALVLDGPALLTKPSRLAEHRPLP